MKKIVFICAAMMAFAATAFAQECEYDQQTGVIKIWKHTGILKGEFTINASGGKVKFAQGNLQYNSDTQKWQFAEYQYIAMQNTSGNIQLTDGGIENNHGIVDMFGWVGASSSWTGLKQYGITSSSSTNAVDGYGNVAGENLKSDWGTLIGPGWRTLTSTEWAYLINNRDNASNLRAQATIWSADSSEVIAQGLVILPDNWVTPAGCSFIGNRVNNYTQNNYKVNGGWAKMEEAGAVFLPKTGRIRGTSSCDYPDSGQYASASSIAGIPGNQILLSFGGWCQTGHNERYYRCAVRLVKDVVVTP